MKTGALVFLLSSTFFLAPMLPGTPFADRALTVLAPGNLAQAQTQETQPAPDAANPEENSGEADGDEEGGVAGANEPGHPLGEQFEVPAIQRDLTVLPFPVAKMRELLIEAARSGDLEKLRPFIGAGDDMTIFSFGGIEGDPIDFLKSISGDGDGMEILAILLDVLETGFVHLEPGTENELYVWPYFFAVPLEKLDAPQKVEMFRLLTSGDYEEMKSFGTYLFYRVGITPQGRWRFFVAGD
ncbi:MAG: hypothetical protein WBO55_08210 [Rhizobiaceae bacterium]